MRGNALETTVEDSMATNIASNRPDSASITSRWLIEVVAASAWPVGRVTGADIGSFLAGTG